MIGATETRQRVRDLQPLVATYGGFESDTYRGTIEGDFSRTLLDLRDARAEIARLREALAAETEALTNVRLAALKLFNHIGKIEYRDGAQLRLDADSNPIVNDLMDALMRTRPPEAAEREPAGTREGRS